LINVAFEKFVVGETSLSYHECWKKAGPVRGRT